MTEDVAGVVHDVPLAEALSQRFLAYALSTIVSRSLPDVRDGLKPVHRRLLYAMRQLRLDPGAGFKKCARVVGDVIGKFHPHGDTAVYDALVRLAQDFAQRYPLVDGQGNFGTLDGDNAAAMRYTEARLTAVAQALLEGIDEDAVDFRRTYDGEDAEPVVLPARFPNLLANGATGIAVGMATSIPPHNVAELAAALRHLIRHRDATVETLVELVPGPDFPTGGVLVEAREAIIAAYRTGRGSFRLRARWRVETGADGEARVIIDEIPFQVAKARLFERIAELMAARRLPLVADVRDESTDIVRIVVAPKRGAAPDQVMEQLFRATDLEVRIGLNMNVLDGGVTPRLMGLKDVLTAFLDHRHDVLVRRSRFRLANIDRRLHVLAGFLVVYANLDVIIRIIREADDAKAELQRRFALDDAQADAILNMRLRQLRRLDEVEIRREHATLGAERAEVTALLADDKRRWKAIDADIAALAREYAGTTPLGRRRTSVAEAPPAIAACEPEADTASEPITVVCSQKGWIRAIKGDLADPGAVRYKQGDGARFVVAATTTDRLLLFADDGRFYTLACARLPSGRGDGEPLRLLVDLAADAVPLALMVLRPGQRLLVAGAGGRGFVVAADAVVAQTRAGRQILLLQSGERAVACSAIDADADTVALIGDNRRLLVIPLADVPKLGRGRGVLLQRFRRGGLADAVAFSRARGLSWRSGRGVRTETEIARWQGKRGGVGAPAPRNFPADNRFSG